MQPKTQEFLQKLQQAGFSQDSAVTAQIVAEWKRLNKLARGKSDLPFDWEFQQMTQGLTSQQQLLERLREQNGFFQRLYVSHDSKFRIVFEPVHSYPDGIREFNVVAFECPKGQKLGLAKFEGYGTKLVLTVFHAKRGANYKKARDVLGEQWYDFFMKRILQAYVPLHQKGIGFEHHIESIHKPTDPKRLLARIIRNRYFVRRPQGLPVGVHPLNRTNPKVKSLLKPK